MSKLSAILACTTVVAVIMVVHLWRQLDAERSNQQLQPGLASAAFDQARALEPQASGRMEAVVTAGAADGNVAAATPALPGVPGQMNATSIDMRQMLRDPEFREAQQARSRLQMPQQYPDLARELGLSPREAETFFDLLAEQQFRRMTLTVAMQEGDEAARDEAGRKLNQAQRDDQAAVAGFLGPGREQAWREYQQGIGARRQVNQLGTLLSAVGNPLTDSQVRPLIDLITVEQQRLKEESRAMANARGSDGQAHNEALLAIARESDNRVVELARSYLNTQQLEALKTSMTHRTSTMRMLVNAGGQAN